MEAIINSVMGWAVGLLLLVVVTLGFTTYTFHAQKVQLQLEVVTVTGKLRESEANLDLAKKSCEATQAITNEVSTKIETKQEQMTKTLVDLVALPPAKDTDNGKKYADDASLSPELMRLLDKAYCDASPTDASCATSGAAKALPSTKAKK